MSERLSPRYLEDFRLLPRAAADRHPARGYAVSPLGCFANALRNPRATGSLRVGEARSLYPEQLEPFSPPVAPGKTEVHARDSMRAAERVAGLAFDRPRSARGKLTATRQEATMRKLLPLLISGAIIGSAAQALAEQIDWRQVDEALGRQATVIGDVHRYGFGRSDLKVTLDGVSLKPALALGGWIAFKPAHGKAMAMGDLVLLESEVAPVVAKLREGGFEITAVHNHLLRANPMPMYVHVAGQGDPAKLAAAIHDALAESKTPLTSKAAESEPSMDLDTAKIDEIIGGRGHVTGGVYQIGVARHEQVTENKMHLTPPGPLGVATGLNFQPTGDGKAAVSGDFVLTADEVNPVIEELQANGIEVTAVHSHMLTEQPRLFFLHFWANDDALKLAKGLQAALDKTARAKS